MLTAERLRELLHYDPDTGVFVRRQTSSTHGSRLLGGPCGSPNKVDSYVVIHVAGRNYRAHRLAWLYVHGVWPDVVDHINHDKTDNRLCNLRSVSRAANTQNSTKPMPSSKSGIRGVSWSAARKRWVASISVGNKVRAIGRFATQEDAHAAYLAARKELHVGFIA